MTTKYASLEEAMRKGFYFAGREDLEVDTLEDAKACNAIVVKENEVIGNMGDPEGLFGTQAQVTIFKFNNSNGSKVKIAVGKYQSNHWNLWLAIGVSGLWLRT
jgi:hypothetical protein